ncbi:GTPase of the mitochondrial inner membrane that associates with the large ribosomal subunit [Ophidiomyces ophidiicola]|uniref:GTPase of the mitochondrial inner membrane that associates with the large ribosomal subunit n=1 Tax=Ophidiomyces ophidiicola TaxID=1387563 RepID=UPI0020C26AE2|nr:GTPase of the mitochondrial inner membrane that associates with the large ribosomal subunit [Ophidiomyces ophidiicola]KAI1947164.1 GTPase of the mitochondrial inner membrane that associates with the large ribosomal subunit [Ophidiomyces ophidiicola]KAI2062467.1 GTPase of the mitochondrial inner membrane that associates with the large ribosomal subunit [Ophidiomyces ophidiicola]
MASFSGNPTLMPFLYPCFLNGYSKVASVFFFNGSKSVKRTLCHRQFSRKTASSRYLDGSQDTPTTNRLNPSPSDYGRSIFQDRCTLRLHTGTGGNGCVSFLREKYISEGPPNGGNGGNGGSIYIQAVEGQTSLHKLARRGVIRAGHGKNGKGKLQGGQRGTDILINVPVGTVVREVGRYDPVAEKGRELRLSMGKMPEKEALRIFSSKREQWVLYPGSRPSDYITMELPVLPPPQRNSIAAMEPSAPIHLDLSERMEQPMLLAAGAIGGRGNPNFISKSNPRPLIATKGESGMMLELEFELKLLADVGLVGLPNAGKSTLLRSITNSRARIGNWAFTTLSPNIGTVVLDDFTGRSLIQSKLGMKQRSRFTIADIPGLVEGAHLDKGLGLGFLRHIERAGILVFVIDLSAGDAIQTLKSLWRELHKYQLLQEQDLNMDNGATFTNAAHSGNFDGPRVFDAYSDDFDSGLESSLKMHRRNLPELEGHPAYTKPWLVVGTKADLPKTQENFALLRAYLADVENGVVEHPSLHEDAWRKRLHSIPVSALNAEGVNAIPQAIIQLLDTD